MKISLVIVAYKNGNILLDCLNSIEKYNDLKDELEVIVVDNSPVNERVESFVKLSSIQNIYLSTIKVLVLVIMWVPRLVRER